MTNILGVPLWRVSQPCVGYEIVYLFPAGRVPLDQNSIKITSILDAYRQKMRFPRPKTTFTGGFKRNYSLIFMCMNGETKLYTSIYKVYFIL